MWRQLLNPTTAFPSWTPINIPYLVYAAQVNVPSTYSSAQQALVTTLNRTISPVYNAMHSHIGLDLALQHDS